MHPARLEPLIRALPHQSPREGLPQRGALLGDWCGTSAGYCPGGAKNPSLALRARFRNLSTSLTGILRGDGISFRFDISRFVL